LNCISEKQNQRFSSLKMGGFLSSWNLEQFSFVFTRARGASDDQD